MISSEVQRTLVKSPPELWTELSDPAVLARHLGELGEIRITTTEPEHKVEWEGDGINGTVMIKPSGWGTKVTLSVKREVTAPEPKPAAISEEAPPQPDEAESESESITPMDEQAPELDEPERLADLEQEIQTERAQSSPRRGFFSRLFRRRQQETLPDAESSVPAESVAESEPLMPESIATAAEEPAPPAPEPFPAEPTRDVAAELKAAEEVAAEEVTAVLTAVLDRLGAAHHRPFSRA